jgi:hypothetical protein
MEHSVRAHATLAPMHPQQRYSPSSPFLFLLLFVLLRPSGSFSR